MIQPVQIHDAENAMLWARDVLKSQGRKVTRFAPINGKKRTPVGATMEVDGQLVYANFIRNLFYAFGNYVPAHEGPAIGFEGRWLFAARHNGGELLIVSGEKVPVIYAADPQQILDFVRRNPKARFPFKGVDGDAYNIPVSELKVLYKHEPPRQKSLID